MSLRKEFLELMSTKPIPPYATLPNSGIDVEWSELMDGWKIDMGMDVNTFFKRNPDIFQAVQNRFPDLDLRNVSPRDILKRGIAEAILDELIKATDIPGEADRIFKGQRLRNVKSGTLSAKSRDNLYEGALEAGELPERTVRNPEGGVRQSSKPAKTYMGGLVDELTAQRAFAEYSELRAKEFQAAKALGRKPYTKGGQFRVFDQDGKAHYFAFSQAGYKTVDGKKVPAKRSFMSDGMGYKLHKSSQKAFQESIRHGLELKQTPRDLTPRQWLQMKDLYDQASQSGGRLEVDHIYPLEKGGLHAPWNLRLLETKLNRQKSNKLGTDFPDAPYTPRVGFSAKEWGQADRLSSVHGNKALLRNIGGFSSLYGKNLRASTAVTDFALTGNPLSGAAALAHTSPVQKRVLRPAAETIGKQIAKLTAKRAGGTVLKTALPVVGDLAIGGAMTYGYLQQGRYNQALWEAISTGVGFVPLVGDAASATIDATQLARDIQYIRRGIGN